MIVQQARGLGRLEAVQVASTQRGQEEGTVVQIVPGGGIHEGQLNGIGGTQKHGHKRDTVSVYRGDEFLDLGSSSENHKEQTDLGERLGDGIISDM